MLNRQATVAIAAIIVLSIAASTTYIFTQFGVNGVRPATEGSPLTSSQGSGALAVCGTVCSNFTAHSIGYIGCSISEISVTGYNGATNKGLFWNPAYPTGGGVINDWANPSSSYWSGFESQLARFGQPRAVWVQVCVANPIKASYSLVASAIQILRSKAPHAVFFVSPLVTYGPGTNCGFGNVTGSYSLANEAVANGLGLAGPDLGPWSVADMGGASCDPHTSSALSLVGTQLTSFFG